VEEAMEEGEEEAEEEEWGGKGGGQAMIWHVLVRLDYIFMYLYKHTRT